MVNAASTDRVRNAHFWRQVLKWTVYTLLTINFAFYLQDDWVRTAHTISDDDTVLRILSGFATSIAVLAWITLLLLLELETYLLEDDQFTPWSLNLMRAVRALCVVTIGYTTFAFGEYVVNITPTLPVEDATENICQLADRGLSYTNNLAYTEITAENCASLSSAAEFFWLDGKEVVTDPDGLKLERWLAWGDFAEVTIWLVILIAIEIVVRLQDRGVTGGVLMRSLNSSKYVGYTLLLGLAIWWVSLSHWLYMWDTLLWIGGFIAIEGNLREWRDEIKEVKLAARDG